MEKDLTSRFVAGVTLLLFGLLAVILLLMVVNNQIIQPTFLDLEDVTSTLKFFRHLLWPEYWCYSFHTCYVDCHWKGHAHWNIFETQPPLTLNLWPWPWNSCGTSEGQGVEATLWYVDFLSGMVCTAIFLLPCHHCLRTYCLDLDIQNTKYKYKYILVAPPVPLALQRFAILQAEWHACFSGAIWVIRPPVLEPASCDG